MYDANEGDLVKRETTTGEPAQVRTHTGTCFCGAVEVRVTGEPVAMGFCHCNSCRSWSASPVNGFMLWKPNAVELTRGRDQVETFNKTERSYRKWCRRCGGHLMSEHPHWGLIDVFAGTIPSYPFKPGVHVNYGERTLRIADGLPKLRDFPSELGGSGEVVPE